MFQLRLFQRESYDYKEIFSQHIAGLRSLQSRDKLLSVALSSLAEIFAVRSASILLRTSDEGAYLVKSRLGAAPLHFKLAGRSPLVNWLKSHDEPLTIEAITTVRFPKHRDRFLKVFVELKASALVPLRIEGKLLGFVAIAAPEGRRSFNKEERELLSLFGYELSISIQNSLLYDEVLRQNAKLKELSVLKGNFVGNMTHELATPLHNIIGLAQALADGVDGVVNEEQRNHLAMIKSAGEQLLNIHRAILDLSQLESCPEQLTIKKFPIDKVLEEQIQSMQAQIQARDIQLIQAWGPGLPSVYGDEEKVRLVLEKLLENAIQFTAQGEVRIQAELAGDKVKITVADTGTGIDPAHLADIFEAFRQVDGGMTRSHGGAGLGLALAKKIIELHGGRLWVESSPGIGSRFYFTLPTRPANIRALEVTSY